MKKYNFMFRSFIFSLASALAIVGSSTVKAEAKLPKKVVFIAGKKSHGPGEHEYEKSVKLLKVMLDHAQNIKGIKTEVCFNGWPEDASTLDNADVIVVFADGSDFHEQDDPLFTDDHLSVIQKQMSRGCSLVLLHYSTFAPNKFADQFLEWIGGYYDYQSGAPDSTGKPTPMSALLKETATAAPVTPAHPISRGLVPFTVHEEFYYHIHFKPSDNRFVPILNVPITGIDDAQTVAWAVERKDGGRGFAYTGGHYYVNWENPTYRKMILNAIVWAAGLRIPKGGVESEYYTEEQVTKLLNEKAAN